MSDIILVCENLEVVLTGTHVQTKVNLSNKLCFEAKKKTKKKTANTLIFYFYDQHFMHN